MDSSITNTRPYPELTWVAVIVGWILGVIIAVSIGYAALILGFSIEGSELAAILGFGILRGVLRRKSIIENNIVQTIASGVNGASSGMMFSVPAIFLLGYGDRFDPVILTFGCIAGAFLGIAFIIPLRKHMIDFERLTYPGGVAVATILKSPGAGVRKAIILLGAAALSASVHFATIQTETANWDLGAAMEEHGLDALVVSGSEYSGFEGAVRYLTGFHILHRYAYVVITPNDDPIVVFPREATWVGDHSATFVQRRMRWRRR